MTTPSEQVVSPLYADRMVIGPLSDALKNTKPIAGSSQSVSNNQRFWSTPWRDEADATREILEIRLSGDRPINAIDLAHAHYPHRLYIEWMDSSKNWHPVIDTSGNPIMTLLRDSVPGYVGSPDVRRRRPDHPFHIVNRPDHWVLENFFFPPVTTTRIRFIMVREPSYTPGVGGPLYSPQQPSHPHHIYPLAIKDLNIGYKVGSVKDIPADAFSSGNSFASTLDMLGSRIQFQVHRELPSDIFKNKTWRSEPQPISSAVVNFYADVRDAHGAGQVIDRFFLDPLYVGPTLNLYYSNDSPSGVFEATEDALSFPALIAQGDIQPHFGAGDLVFDGTGPSFIDLNNSAVQFDPTQPFWFGFELQVHFDSAPILIHPILDIGPMWLNFESNAIRVTTARGESVSVPIQFTTNNVMQIFVGWLPKPTDEWDAGLYLAAGLVNGNTVISHTPLVAPFAVTDQVSTIRIGGFQNRDPGVPNFELNSMILKVENLSVETIQLYQSIGGSNFTRKPFYQFDTDNTQNALVRFDARFTNGADNTLGFRGGPGTPYDDVVWTPIARHYKMAKGYMMLPPTRAKFFKFEMSNLVPENYESFTPISRRVKVFSTYQTQQWAAQVGINSNTPTDQKVPGLSTIDQLTYANRYSDAAASLAANPVPGKYGPTSALYSKSPTVQQSLADAHWAYGFQPWQRSQVAPRFQEIGTHVYEQIEITHKNKVGYFTGLKALQAMRVTYVSADDTEVYDEQFHDALHLATNNWIEVSNSLRTPEGNGPAYVVAQSVPYGSTRAVKGVQFAAQQTSAKLLNSNDDFTDDSNASVPPGFSSYGDASLISGVREGVVKRVAPRTWGDVDGLFYGQDLDQMTYGDIERIPRKGPADVGGMGSDLVTPSDAGRIQAAARVTAPADLASPLFLQIVGQDETVLAETQINIHAGETVEAKAGYTIGTVNRPSPTKWGDIEAKVVAHTSYGQLEQFTYGQLQSAPFAGDVRARVVQFGRSADEFRVQALSLFDEGILWEFSNDNGVNWYPAVDVRNDPRGVLIFPDYGTVTPHPVLMWRVRGYRQGLTISALRIRPWYAGMLSGISPSHGIAPPGPNVTPYDHYSDILDDPAWKLSHDPIPKWWYTGGRPIPVGPIEPVPVPPDADPPPFDYPTGIDEGGTDPGQTVPSQYYIPTSDDITMPNDLVRTSQGNKAVLARLTETLPPANATTVSLRKSLRYPIEDYPLIADSADIRINGHAP